MVPRRSSWPWLLAAALVLAGCQRGLNVERSVEVEPHEVKSVIIDAPKKDQTLKVEVRSPGAPVDVYLVLEKDREAVERQLTDDRKTSNALASKLKVEADTLEANVPANSGFAVLLMHRKPKSITVGLKVTGS